MKKLIFSLSVVSLLAFSVACNRSGNEQIGQDGQMGGDVQMEQERQRQDTDAQRFPHTESESAPETEPVTP